MALYLVESFFNMYLKSSPFEYDGAHESFGFRLYCSQAVKTQGLKITEEIRKRASIW